MRCRPTAMNRPRPRDARRGRQGVGPAGTSNSVKRRRKRIRRVLLIWVSILMLAGIVRACWMRQEQRATPRAYDRKPLRILVLADVRPAWSSAVGRVFSSSHYRLAANCCAQHANAQKYFRWRTASREAAERRVSMSPAPDPVLQKRLRSRRQL